MRRTPRSASWETVSSQLKPETRTLTGFGATALRDAKLCISGYRFGFIGESVQEIGVDRQRRGSSNFTNVPEHFVEGNAAIGSAAGKGETGGGGGERFEAEMFQINRRADIP